MQISTRGLRAACLASLVPIAASIGKCGMVGAASLTGPYHDNLFCSGVTWNASLPLAPAALDAAAKSDFELALDRLHKLGGAASLPLCLESWKALQCASKFQKCSKDNPAQKVCRSLCFQFADMCNGSQAVR